MLSCYRVRFFIVLSCYRVIVFVFYIALSCYRVIVFLFCYRVIVVLCYCSSWSNSQTIFSYVISTNNYVATHKKLNSSDNEWIFIVRLDNKWIFIVLLCNQFWRALTLTWVGSNPFWSDTKGILSVSQTMRQSLLWCSALYIRTRSACPRVKGFCNQKLMAWQDAKQHGDHSNPDWRTTILHIYTCLCVLVI